MSSPRILDGALAAAMTDRATEERRAPALRAGRPRAAPWLVPALAALVAIGLTAGRGPPAAGGSWAEAPAAVVFLALGAWMLRNALDPGR
jgi:hypothetical protein